LFGHATPSFYSSAFSEKLQYQVNFVWIGSSLLTEILCGETVLIFFASRDTNMASCVSENYFFCVKFIFFLQTLFLPGKKVASFDTTPNQFVSLVPNFWSWPMWKAAMFMHHDVAVLEEVL